ncbi:hypothetical protein EGW08_001418 [Elysia chlorotica]|uniref:Ig-like domain-containing protein n=1 Tax=Elysia chlorotica TaxID=188477 RepID=A0A3S1BL12_ELYCH|nr:hypothetical protein EGW08_001418 [Elysia chlorotica]
MFVIAGFPEVLTTGALVDYTYTSLESQSGVVLKHFPDKCQTLVVDLKTRKRHTVKDQQVTCRTDVADILESACMDKFVLFAVDVISRIQAGEEISVETLWVLSLVLKVLNRCFQNETLMAAVSKNVFSGSFVQCLVSLCCKGTGLNQNWLLKDLEVLSLMWYTHDGSSSKRSKHKNTKRQKKEESKKLKKSPDGTDSEDEFSDMFMSCKDGFKEDDVYNDDDNGSLHLFGESDDDEGDLSCPTDSSSDSSLTSKDKSAYDSDEGASPTKSEKMNDKLLNALGLDATGKESLPAGSKTEVAASSTDSDKKESDKAKEGDTKDAASEKDSLTEMEDMWSQLNLEPDLKKFIVGLHAEFDIPILVLHAVCSMSNGDSDEVLKFIVENCGEGKEKKLADFIKKWRDSSEEEQKDKFMTDSVYIDKGIARHSSEDKVKRVLKVAEDEMGDNPQNLFQQQEILAREISERQRGKSAQLLKKELEKHGRAGPRDSLHKVNLAMCVLYARHTLTSLLAHWPDDGPPINSSLMGCKDVKQIPSVLDLLHKIDSQFFFSKVVDKVIHLCDAASLVPIAFTAAQFMEELKLQAVTCESAHNYTLADKKKGQVQLPGASYLTITFDSRCATAEDDILKFSDSQKLCSTSHMFCGSSSTKWSSFSLPGDSLFYRFCLEDYDPDMSNYWGYKFTVTPGICDSFETGHTILKAVLSSTVARSLPLDQLWTSLVYVACKQPGTQRLKVINLMLKIVALQGKANCDNESKTMPDIDLSLLKPLWDLYQNMTNKDTDQTNTACGASSGGNSKPGTSFQPAVMRALTTLFLQTENLANEWGITDEYLAALSDIYPSLFQGLFNVAAVGSEISYPNLATDLFKNLMGMIADGDVMSTLESRLINSKSVVEEKNSPTKPKDKDK